MIAVYEPQRRAAKPAARRTRALVGMARLLAAPSVGWLSVGCGIWTDETAVVLEGIMLELGKSEMLVDEKEVIDELVVVCLVEVEVVVVLECFVLVELVLELDFEVEVDVEVAGGGVWETRPPVTL